MPLCIGDSEQDSKDSLDKSNEYQDSESEGEQDKEDSYQESDE